MPYSSSGAFYPLIVFVNALSSPTLLPGQQTSGPPALAEGMNAEFADIVSGLGQAVTRAGYGSMQANLPMGGNKVISVAAGTNPTDGANVSQLPGNGIAPLIQTGSVNPTASATYVGQMYINTATNKIFFSTATGTGASDWSLVN